MPFLMTNPFQPKAQLTQNNKICVWLIGLSAIFSCSLIANPLTPYNAEYQISRKGSVQGIAYRELKQIDVDIYQLKYKSDIEWMIFSDEREETSLFKIHDAKPSPIEYSMIRTGTGPDRDYKITFDHKNQAVMSNQDKYPLDVKWLVQQQDLLTYQVQLRNDLKAGKQKFSYPIIDKKGNQRTYDFVVDGKETITLPIGNVETIRIKRVYDNDKRQATVWLAPEYDYMVVKMYKGKEGIEQFQVQLTKYEKQVTM
ncbi:hypothetical protein PSECIP111854_00770 [Pseudoalteromonas sp. CIP111854]|uniref:DUF3108 domain-containing protein n=1 Tax=Pseudoalteromonas holothuriae TaxID=2963714 RepID=A0A9W4VME1_9GAMM|nr:DUF3108 domain-containing protein [Pseudoalteromonas sp. CIP111854]CAH9051562.1 hypothetical protein PSECIP111854_00770 [Pseudoalteromonas sp. CIP111854]